ncbi:Oidioi.mRNA.OKI2018_I69.XSR.g15051.t1.cds [Oikopleura dioica]|uniref:Oidioi.mRNA.OKI2018_I69.XSR.g15051.t1.cds n=1 Tax=Oikopleura dioica TaxID=34765 RepID=A0ABN7SBL0_OIKDI|nr:Oidioi.mRNA.OKI2018_I69.XSR.g15051.t1.cds [Oikopleura dioica]
MLKKLFVSVMAALLVVGHGSPINWNKRQTGWTLNSIGYNAGLNALQKLFGKRMVKRGTSHEEMLQDDSAELLELERILSDYLNSPAFNYK